MHVHMCTCTYIAGITQDIVFKSLADGDNLLYNRYNIIIEHTICTYDNMNEILDYYGEFNFPLTLLKAAIGFPPILSMTLSLPYH